MQLYSDARPPPDHNRALDNPSTIPAGNMTIEACLDYCSDHGFEIAGLEYSQECCK